MPRVRRLSKRDKRTLTLGGGCVAAMLMVGRGLPALVAWRAEVTTSAAAASDSANRMSALASLARAPRRDASRMRDMRQTLDRILIHGDSGEPMGVALAERVKAAAVAAGTDVASIEIDGDTSRIGSLRIATVRLDASGDMDSITQMLEALELGPPALALDEVLMTPSGVAAPGSTEPLIHAQLLVRGVGEAVRPRADEGRQ